MSCMLYYNFFQILKQKKSYIISYFIVFLFCLFFLKLFDFDENILFYGSLGLSLSNKHILITILYIFHRIFFLFISFYIFTYDFSNSIDNIFLRIKSGKFILLKCFSIFMSTLVIKLVVYALFFLIAKLFFTMDIDFLTFISVFLLDLLYFSFIQFFFLLFYLIFQCYLIAGIVFSIISVGFISLVFPSYSYLNQWFWIYLLLLIPIIISLYIIYKNKYVIIFERNRG